MKGNSRINECCFVMLIISWLSVLPHKHPHELLDSVVKEQLVKSFVSTEARILQQPLYLSSCFSILFPEKLLSTQPLAPSIRTSSLQREAHSTAFKTAVNTSFFYRFRSIRSNHQQSQTTTLPTGAHSTRQIQLCKPFIQLNLLINKKFLKRFIAEVARILHEHDEL